MELAEICQCGLSIDSGCLSLRSQAKRLQIVKVKAQDNYDSLDLSLLWESGYGLKKKDIVTPLSPTVLSVECVLWVSNFKEYPEKKTLSHLLPTTVSCLKFEETPWSDCLTLHSLTKQLMPQWKTLKHSGVWCMVVFAVPTGRSNEGMG